MTNPADPAAPLGTPQAGTPRQQEIRFERRRGGSFFSWIIAIALILVVGGVIWAYSTNRVAPTAANMASPASTSANTAPGVPDRSTRPQENTGAQ
jgi:hypothetical protein